MEPLPEYEFVLINIVPLFAFFAGVLIADRVRLYVDLGRTHMWILSIPTGLLSVGMLISSAAATVDGVSYHGYMESFADYIMFCAIIMFYGTAAPELFASLRTQLLRR